MAQQDFIIQVDSAGNAEGFAISEIKSFTLEHRNSGVGIVVILFVDTGKPDLTIFHGPQAEALYKELRKLAIVI